MRNKYLITSFIILSLFVTACSETFSEPTKIVQFEILEANDEVSLSLQKRLVALGANNVKVVNNNQSKITFSYQGNIKPEKLQKGFKTIGKLEFFEAIRDEQLMIQYIINVHNSYNPDENTATQKLAKANAFKDFINIVRMSPGNFGNGQIGTIDAKDKEALKALSIYQKPFFVPAYKKRVKFLLGKSDTKNEYALFAVYMTAKNKAPLDGTYVTNASAVKGYFEGKYSLNIQLNDKGAIIWERLTEKAYQEYGGIAIVIDDLIHAVPIVTAGKITGGNMEVSGNFSREEAQSLSTIIASGAIPKVKIIKMGTLEEATTSK